MNKYVYPSVMTVAGFDPSGGAGIQADIKTISALGCFATSALTALPVQNTLGVQTIYPIPVEVVAEQMRAIIDDIPPDAIKIGMVHSTELVDTIVGVLGEFYPRMVRAESPTGAGESAQRTGATKAGRGDIRYPNIVFDPVMVSTSGHRLIEEATIGAIVEKIFPLAAIVTPNMDEAAVLAGMAVATLDDMYAAGEKILKLGPRSLLLKGGHLTTARLTSIFFDSGGGITEFHSDRVDTCNTHGSGCSLSSAIASRLARGETIADAVAGAQEWVAQAILHGSDVKIGRGNGPLNHFWHPEKLIKK